MAIERKTGLFYELLIRGHYGGAHQTVGELGAFEAAHYIEAEAVVDTATGEVIQVKPGPAVELPRDKIVSFLGDRFADFESGHRALAAERDQLAASVADLTAKLKQAEADRDAAHTAQAQAADRLAKVTAHISSAAAAAGD
jgi:hypothetical protein